MAGDRSSPAPPLEALVTSSHDAAICASSGCRQMELCACLAVGGLTPSLALVEDASRAAEASIVSILVRCREGGFLYDEAEISTMERDVRIMSGAGFNAFSVGSLCVNYPGRGEGLWINLDHLKRLCAAASSSASSRTAAATVTLHRCIDDVLASFDPVSCPGRLKLLLQDVCELGIARVLTSGGRATAIEGLKVMKAMRDCIDEHSLPLKIVAAAGINESNVTKLCEVAHVCHVGSFIREEFVEGGGGYKSDIFSGHSRVSGEKVKGLLALLDAKGDSSCATQVDALQQLTKSFVVESVTSVLESYANPLLSPLGFAVSLASEGDLSDAMAQIKSLAIYEKEPDAVNVTRSQLLCDGFGGAPLFHCLLLHSKAEPKGAIGMAFFYFAYSTRDGRFLYLEDLYVEEKYRGKGAGKTLMRTLARVAVKTHCKRMAWQALDWNQGAIDFYERIGAKLLKKLLTFRLDEQSLSSIAKYESCEVQQLTRSLVKSSVEGVVEHFANPLLSPLGLAVSLASEGDLSDAMAQIKNLAVYEKDPDSVNVTRSQLLCDGFGGAPLFHCLLLHSRAEPKGAIGIAFFYFAYSTWEGRVLYLEDLYVEEKYRGKGAGKTLMRTLARDAVKTHCKRMTWQALDWNQSAIDFYQRIGAKQLREWMTFRFGEKSLKSFASQEA